MSYFSTAQFTKTSVLISPDSADAFFNPVACGLTGFGYDGFEYTAGIRGGSTASWASGLNTDFRGSEVAFPSPSIALLSEASLTILDVSSGSLWMTFLNGDDLTVPTNFTGTSGFTPSRLSYTSGVIVVTGTPDAASAIQSSVGICIDFVQDKVYIEVAQ